MDPLKGLRLFFYDIGSRKHAPAHVRQVHANSAPLFRIASNDTDETEQIGSNTNNLEEDRP